MSERKIKGEWMIVWFIATVCLLMLGWYARQFTYKPPVMPTPPMGIPKIVVKPVEKDVVNPPHKFVGHVEAQEAVEVKARVGGYLTEVAFLEGDVVKAGDLLFTIDEEDYKARVAQREAEIARSKAEIARAEAALERAESVLKRLEAADARSVSLIDLDNARADVSATKAALVATKAALVGAEANLELAKIDLKHTKVHAPITGKIGRRLVSKGDYIVPAVPLVRVVQLDPVRVVFSVTDRDFVEFKTRADVRGDSEKIRARIVLPTGEEYPYPGIWDFFDNRMSASTATLTVWMMAENKEGILLPNTYVTVLVEGSAFEATPVVDLAAVTRNVQGAYVYTLSASNTVEMARVKLGLATDKVVAIESGLSVGDRVVVEGIQNVRPGVAVEVMDK
jgi:membrane fusion protein (multidrug efflux system)